MPSLMYWFDSSFDVSTRGNTAIEAMEPVGPEEGDRRTAHPIIKIKRAKIGTTTQRRRATCLLRFDGLTTRRWEAKEGVIIRRRSTAISLGDWYRSSGSFSRHFRMISSSLCETLGLASRGGGGGPCRISSTSCDINSALNGRRPVDIS